MVSKNSFVGGFEMTEDLSRAATGASGEIWAGNTEHGAPIYHSSTPELSESRVPHRNGKLAKRESKLSLRNIFVRSKNNKGGKGLEDFSSSSASLSSRSSSKPPVARGSLAELTYGSNPYRTKQPNRSENSVTPSITSSLPVTNNDTDDLQHQSSKNVVVSWQSPPLFQVEPQAMRQATLPAYNASVEALVRMQEGRSGIPHEDAPSDAATSELSDRPSSGKKTDGAKRKFWPGPSNWTKKIYVLVTSGYLLQYAAEGSFDRQPEKILPLGRQSAVFASDLIPGKHWVLQVASTMSPSGQSPSESKSLVSKFTSRGGPEKKHTSNLLLVFESADDMDSWLATLRAEIELLGGKKKLSETGKQTATNQAALGALTGTLRRSPSTRNQERFSRVVRQDFSWKHENPLTNPYQRDSAMFDTEQLPELSHDDVSTTASMNSSDGQRLDSLRDSTNRLSFMSSGQRTIVTSACSSPACSPIRGSFSSQGDEYQMQDSSSSPKTTEARARPNASAIMNRRRSMQTMMSGSDRSDAGSRPRSTISVASSYDGRHDQQNNAHLVPNFSVPQSASRRFSSIITSSSETITPSTESLNQETYSRPARKGPPTALAISRPLSVVLDQPSPRSPSTPGSWVRRTSFNNSVSPSPSPLAATSSTTSDHDRSLPFSKLKRVSLSIRQKHASSRLDVPTSPRKYPSMNDIQHHDMEEEIMSPQIVEQSPPPPTFSEKSVLRTRVSAAPAELVRKPGRHSLIEAPPKYSFVSRRASQMLPQRQTRFPPSVDSQPRALAPRRSLPQLAEGPPPAPPPTCALPPIPPPPPPTAPPPTCALPPIPKQRRSQIGLSASAATLRA